MIKVLLRKHFILPILFWLIASVVSFPSAVQADDTGTASIAVTKILIDNGGYAVKKNSSYLVAHNLHTPYVPASTIKIATALAALDILGPAFRFQTSFYRDAADNLYIKGYGDPFLTSEEVAVIVSRLKELGCAEINDIYLDSSAFDLTASADGTGASDNPYDALNSALAVNFNTVNIEKDAAGRVISAERQTPTLQLMKKLAQELEPGLHRINITHEKDAGDAIASRYAGELFRAFQKQGGIGGAGRLARRTTPENLEPFYTHHSSKTLGNIIEPLMLYSNNFIANQIFLTLGANRYGYPATWEKSVQVMAEYLQQKHKLPAKEIKIVEGSGLSRRNRVSPYAMVQLLDSFKPYARFLPQEDGRLLKSGTLKGVYAYAGYFMDRERFDSFVLLLNQGKNTRDKVLHELERIYRSN